MGRPGKKRYVSVFAKSVIAFFILGFIPLLVIGLVVYDRNIKEVRNNAIDNARQTTRIVKDDIETLLERVAECSRYLYEYETDDYGYFYDIVRDIKISDILKENLVEDALKMILYQNEFIDHVYFISRDGCIYSSTRAPEKMINFDEMRKWGELYCSDVKNEITLVPTHEIAYYLNAEEKEFTYVRNIMNIQSIGTAGREVLGTLFIDVKTDCFEDIFDGADINKNGQFLVADIKDYVSVFSNYDETETSYDIQALQQKPGEQEAEFCLKLNDMYLIGHLIGETQWVIVRKLPLSSLERMYDSIVKNTLLLILVSIFFMLLLYWYSSRTIGRPIRVLTRAMDEIKAGNLDTHVELVTNDEMELLAEGLNNMTEQLQRHIEKVYISEIRQKEAQFGSLLTQIQPHYLYNTLDAIRMSAIGNDDYVTASMLESLSGQMRYLISDSRNIVSLKEELDNVRNYFIIVNIRYEKAICLEIDAAEETLDCRIPRLTLQPLVENAVKYGVAPKGKGTVAVYTKIKQGYLDIVIIDDGVGMDQAALSRANAILHGMQEDSKNENKKFSIGLKNVQDRIKLQFGEAYGIEILSTQALGTYVHCRLPVLHEEGEG